MTTVPLRYVRRKRGNLFWEPTPTMRALGFLPKPLGPETPDSIAEAGRLYQSWLKAQAERGRVTTYPPGTFGAFWDRLKGTSDRPSAWWGAKAIRTREDYERAWVHIDAWKPKPGQPTLSRTVVPLITTELCEQFYAHLDQTVSPRERWRVIKGLKILLADAVVRLRLGYASPAAKLTNPQPRGRSAIWLGAEVEKLARVAQVNGYPGMSISIRIAWETLFAPIDVWSIHFAWLKRDAEGWYIERERTKTSKEAFGALSEGLGADLQAYIASLPIELTPDALIIRQRNGNAYISKDTFGDDFRAVRAIAFPDDKRQFLDIRRSANVEADAAGADKKTMGELLANGLADNKFLDDTYTPPTITKAREVATQRLVGRRRLAAEVTRVVRSDSPS
jgi:hypothetical protein